MVSLREVDSKVLRMAIQFVSMFSDERQNGECNVQNFRRFLFDISPDVPAFKVCIFTSDFTHLKLRGQNSTTKGSFLTPLAESTMHRLKKGHF